MPRRPPPPLAHADDCRDTRRVQDLFRSRLALADEQAVTLDCAEVTSVDLSFVQLLIAARRSALAAGKRFAVAGSPGPAVLAALEQGGFLGEGADPSEPSLWRQDAAPA